MFRAVPGNPLYGYGRLLPQLGMPFQEKTTRLREVRGIYFSDGVFTGRESHTSHESKETPLNAIAATTIICTSFIFLSSSKAKAQSTVQEAAQQFLYDTAYMSQACDNGRSINRNQRISNFLGNTWDPKYWPVTAETSLQQATTLVYG